MHELAEQSKQLLELLKNQKTRVAACRDNIWLFSLYYFGRYHFFPMPQFHIEMYEDLKFDKYNILLWEMYRESAKTTLAKIKVIHSICYGDKHFIPWVSFDEKKAEANLLDVARELQLNDRINEDFGQLFFDDTLTADKSSKKKSMNEFITSNNIKVKAYSVGMSIRGEVFGPYRPDLYVLDDIETLKTIISDSRTGQVIAFIDELLSGIAGDADIIILANKISNDGSIVYLEEKLTKIKTAKIMNVPVMTEDNKIIWPERYTLTDAEAEKINRGIEDKKKRVISLESKRRLLGETVYNREMLNRPLTEDEREFRWIWLQRNYKEEDLKNKLVNTYVMIDIANTKDRKNAKKKGDPDYTGITVLSVDAFNNWYVRYAKRERLNAPEKIDKIFWLWDTFKPSRIGVEKVAFHDEIEPYIRIKSEETGIYPVVVELEHHGMNKEERIRGALQGRAQAGKLNFKEEFHDDTDKLKQELYDFPKARHDDLSDSLAYGEQLAVAPILQNQGKILTSIQQEFLEERKSSSVGVFTKKLLRL